MKIFYIFPKYHSHYRAALAYCRILRQWHTFVDHIEAADIVFLHCEPHDYGSLYRAYGLTNKYVVSCAVWEANELPESYRCSLGYVQEVWVPSSYCKEAFQRHHPCVQIVPYVLDRPPFVSEADRFRIRNILDYDERCIYYLTITKLWDKRKNAELLIDVFSDLGPSMPDARLVVKASHGDKSLRSDDPRIKVLCGNLEGPLVSALYECCHVYVSAHHSEGWGLTLADALLISLL